MPVQRLNHAVLYVRDVERSHAFYRDVLGFRMKMEIPGRAVFLGGTPSEPLSLVDLDLCTGTYRIVRRSAAVRGSGRGPGR